MPTESVTESVVRALVHIGYEDLPADAVHNAKRMTLDAIGVAIAGASDPQYGPISDYGRSFVGEGRIPAPGTRSFDVANAAYFTAIAMHLLDFDDTQSTMGGHPSVALMPTICSLGYLLRASGEQVVRSIVIGLELEARLGAAMNPAHYSVGWHPTSVIGSLGAAMAASCLLDLDEAHTRTALGIAASFASGTKANFGTLVKSMHAGAACRAGIEAALLAQAGATANQNILDGQFGGFLELYTPDVDRAKLTRDVASGLAIVNPGINFKLLPCCGSIQSSAWSVISLFEAGQIADKNIRAIRSYVDKARIPHTDRPVVQNGLQAKFSSQYCLAVAALSGRLTLADFDNLAITDERRQSLMKKVTITPAENTGDWPNLDGSQTGPRGALVEIEFGDGSVLSQFTASPVGSSSNPASDDDLIKKFVGCATRDGRTTDDAAALADQIITMEKVVSVQPLLDFAWHNRFHQGASDQHHYETVQ